MRTIQWRVRPEYCHPHTMKMDREWTKYLSWLDSLAEKAVRKLNRKALSAAKHPKRNGGSHVFEYRVKP